MVRFLRLFRFLVLGLAGSSAWAASATSADEPQPAVWKSREVILTYAGFTNRYSCEGLRDKVEEALATLGARSDMTVSTRACSGHGKPERFPSVRIELSTLTPAPERAAGTVEARWKTVRLSGPGKLTHSECELAEQIQHEILPLFTTRNVKARTNCVPNQESAGDITLTLDVLIPTTEKATR